MKEDCSRGGTVFVGFLAALSFLGACPRDGSTTNLLDCGQGDEEFARRLDTILPDYTMCVVDSDCTHLTPDLDCEDTRTGISNCPYPVSIAQSKTFLDAVADIGTELCPEIAPDCHVAGSCIPATVECFEKHCRSKYASQ